MPAGEIVRHTLPGQSAREQSAGVTLARRVPTTTKGGGGPPWSGGGGGARGGGWGHLWKLRWSPPPSRWGRVTRPVRSGCGGGGGRGGDLGVGKARPAPRTLRALPEHPAEVAVPRARPWRGRGRWSVLLVFYRGEGRPGSCCLPAPIHLCLCCGVAASSPVVQAHARVGHGEGWAQGREHKSTSMGIQSLACRVRFRCCSLVPVPVSCLREAARHSPRGVEARAGRMGSGRRPRRTRRHAGAGPVAVAGGVRVVQPAVASGPERPTQWGRWACRGRASPAGQAARGACARASACPVRAPLRADGPAVSRLRYLGAEAGAGRMGSGGRPRRRRRRAGAGPVAVAGRRGRPSRRLAEAPRAPHSGVGGRAGGERAVQAKLRGAHPQGCRRACRGPPAGRGTCGWQEALLGG